MLSIKEVHFYNNLVAKGVASRINCPFDDYEHIVICNTNDKLEVYFECITCDTIFYPGVNTEKIIKNTIENIKRMM